MQTVIQGRAHGGRKRGRKRGSCPATHARTPTHPEPHTRPPSRGQMRGRVCASDGASTLRRRRYGLWQASRPGAGLPAPPPLPASGWGVCVSRLLNDSGVCTVCPPPPPAVCAGRALAAATARRDLGPPLKRICAPKVPSGTPNLHHVLAWGGQCLQRNVCRPATNQRPP